VPEAPHPHAPVDWLQVYPFGHMPGGWLHGGVLPQTPATQYWAGAQAGPLPQPHSPLDWQTLPFRQADVLQFAWQVVPSHTWFDGLHAVPVVPQVGKQPTPATQLVPLPHMTVNIGPTVQPPPTQVPLTHTWPGPQPDGPPPVQLVTQLPAP
jgi:hypothetical protein